jgi:polar amino acid transport system substrate-binding protein
MIGSAYPRRDLLRMGAAAMLLGGCRARMRDPHVMIVGSSPTGVPFSFVDPWTNALAGSMVDTARAVVTAIGMRADFQITPFAALIPSLTAGKIDVIAAAILRTPEREKIVAFSDPVYAYAGALVVRGENAHDYPDLASLAGLRVGAQVGTRFVDQLATAHVTQISTYDGLSDMLRDLGIGRIDAAYGDEPILRYQLRVGPHRDVRLVEGFRAPAREELCLVLRKGDPRLPGIDTAIAKLRQAAIPQIISHWGLPRA